MQVYILESVPGIAVEPGKTYRAKYDLACEELDYIGAVRVYGGPEGNALGLLHPRRYARFRNLDDSWRGVKAKQRQLAHLRQLRDIARVAREGGVAVNMELAVRGDGLVVDYRFFDPYQQLTRQHDGLVGGDGYTRWQTAGTWTL